MIADDAEISELDEFLTEIVYPEIAHGRLDVDDTISSLISALAVLHATQRAPGAIKSAAQAMIDAEEKMRAEIAGAGSSIFRKH